MNWPQVRFSRATSLSLATFLQLVLGTPDDGEFVAGAYTAEIVQREVVDDNATQTLRLGVGSLVTSGVWVLVANPDAILASVLVVRLVRVAAVLLGRVTNASQTTHGGLCQPGADLGVREEPRHVRVRPFGSRAVGDDRWHP